MSKPHIQLVVAYSTNRVIGKNNTLPWRLPSDLAHFKKTTMGKPIIMGRKTWESLGRPLPGRPNLVVSRNASYVASGATVYTDIHNAINACRTHDTVCIIGGEQIYRISIDLADEIIATEVHTNIQGDAFFPEIDMTYWYEESRAPQNDENGISFDFVHYLRKH